MGSRNLPISRMGSAGPLSGRPQSCSLTCDSELFLSKDDTCPREVGQEVVESREDCTFVEGLLTATSKGQPACNGQGSHIWQAERQPPDIRSCLRPFGLVWQTITQWVIYKNRHLFLTVLEAGSPRSRCLQGEVLVKAFLLVQSHCLAVSTLTEGARGSLQSLFYEVLTPPLRMESSWLKFLPKAPPPNPFTLEC